MLAGKTRGLNLGVLWRNKTSTYAGKVARCVRFQGNGFWTLG